VAEKPDLEVPDEEPDTPRREPEAGGPAAERGVFPGPFRRVERERVGSDRSEGRPVDEGAAHPDRFEAADLALFDAFDGPAVFADPVRVAGRAEVQRADDRMERVRPGVEEGGEDAGAEDDVVVDEPEPVGGPGEEPFRDSVAVAGDVTSLDADMFDDEAPVELKLSERYGSAIPMNELVISPAAIFASPLLETTQ